MAENSQLKATIIVPVYNAEKTVGPCIESLLQQDYKESFEIIAIDDGSSDNSLEILNKYDVKVLQQKNSGPAKARNYGAKEAKGEIIVFTDSDCLAKTDWLRFICQPLEKQTNIVGVQGRYLTKQESLVARFCQAEIEERYDLIKKVEKIELIGTYAAAYRRNIFLETGGFDENFPIASGEDADFSFKLVKMGYQLAFAEEAIVYHQHPESVKKYFWQKFYRGYWRNILYKKNPGKILKDSYTPQTLKIQVLLFAIFLAGLPLPFISLNLLVIPIAALAFHTLLSLKLLQYLKFPAISRILAGSSLILLRSSAIFFGLVCGTVKVLFIKY